MCILLSGFAIISVYIWAWAQFPECFSGLNPFFSLCFLMLFVLNYTVYLLVWPLFCFWPWFCLPTWTSRKIQLTHTSTCLSFMTFRLFLWVKYEIEENSLNLHCYADDSYINVSAEQAYLHPLQYYIHSWVYPWLKILCKDFLKVNCNKNEIIFVGPQTLL